MKKEFETHLNGKWYTVVYTLSAGRKQLTHIYYDDLPIDIAGLFSSDQHSELYAHIMAAMDNNAMSDGMDGRKPFDQRLNEHIAKMDKVSLIDGFDMVDISDLYNENYLEQ